MQGEVYIQREPLSVESKRPFRLQSMCVNREPQQVVQFVGLAYQLCGRAQTFASQLALSPLGSLSLANMQKSVTVEAMKEHYLTLVQLLRYLGLCDAAEAGRLLQGVGQWQNKLDDDNRLIDVIADAYKQYGIELCSLSGAIVLPGSWAEQLMMRLLEVEESFFHFSSLDLPSGLHRSLCEEGRNGLIDIERCQWSGWVKSPVRKGDVYENSALSRIEAQIELMDFRIGLPLVDRVRAKWFDAAVFWQSLGCGKNDYERPVFGVNRSGDTCQSWVETARGRLYHLAHVESGKVTDYAICAPTEWNFHPDGVAKQLLNELSKQVSDSKRWEEFAALCAQVIDPCVPVRFVA
ncbi:hypothetical protein [Thiomicrorhabdus heinhorstiae]|uniref:Uncharacterized protein n=1 Tax=Thiomicrorhabdus heinhorstiae TaxID=2748010 RepID=A0ABS0BV32_9GAMM|nr:hypothetical protein [Thiomicrorhabdus heinhorstiae]MBF6057678.1 hypothetical protein [Thiomicrorhabdus heinhorstiae]